MINLYDAGMSVSPNDILMIDILEDGFTVLPTHECDGDTKKCRALILEKRTALVESLKLKAPSLTKMRCGGTSKDG